MPASIHYSRPRINPALATFALLLGLNLLNYIDRYILPGELSLVQNEFHATGQQMGALTTALFVCYMLTAPLTGWLGDRFSRKPLIISGAILWSLATLATAIAPTPAAAAPETAVAAVGTEARAPDAGSGLSGSFLLDSVGQALANVGRNPAYASTVAGLYLSAMISHAQQAFVDTLPSAADSVQPVNAVQSASAVKRIRQ